MYEYVLWLRCIKNSGTRLLGILLHIENDTSGPVGWQGDDGGGGGGRGIHLRFKSSPRVDPVLANANSQFANTIIYGNFLRLYGVKHNMSNHARHILLMKIKFRGRVRKTIRCIVLRFKQRSQKNTTKFAEIFNQPF